MYALSMLFTTLASLAAVSAGGNVLFSQDNMRATVYYDVANGDACGQQNGGPFPADWAVTSGINDGIPMCQNLKKGSLKEINSNQIVAMDHNMLAAHPDWCGKEVKVYRADGSEVTIDDGPLVLYDGCAACMTQGIVDLSAKAFIEASPDRKCGNNPEGLRVEVLDNSPWGGDSGSAPEPPKSSAAPAPSSEAPAPSSEAPAPSSQAPAPSSTSTEAPAPTSSESTAQIPEPSAVSSIVKSAELQGHNFAAKPTAASVKSEQVSSTLTIPDEVPTSVQADQVAPTSGAEAQCQYGKWSCDGNDLQVCNYITNDLLDWECVATCDNYCEVKDNGMVTCQ